MSSLFTLTVDPRCECEREWTLYFGVVYWPLTWIHAAHGWYRYTFFFPESSYSLIFPVATRDDIITDTNINLMLRWWSSAEAQLKLSFSFCLHSPTPVSRGTRPGHVVFCPPRRLTAEMSPKLGTVGWFSSTGLDVRSLSCSATSESLHMIRI